ncbi:PAS sensor-containing diguanylate cyclase [Arcobacter acticola]|jgi:diguanylate cyclase (GGDEF)-like protein/PAS domain S-box-containing protein|uniref:diguanylate cyclase n=1 Tax=Arcobacter acticola TaxID=1849015 RepID=A0A6M8EEU0_9BACT|nr:GGDEF domain-containing protein [Arcobacter acticola]QKE29070.1 PAS sensor-containing diguanylate cyclase [Arcobacter acticola]
MNKKPSYEELEEKIKKLENSSILNSLKQDIKINEIFFKKLFDTIPNPIFYKDINGVYQHCNDAFSKTILGIAKEEIIGKTLCDLEEVIPKEYAEIYHEKDQELFLAVKEQFYEAKVKCADEEIRSYQFYKSTFVVDGEILGLVGVMLDVGDYKKTLNELDEKNKLLSNLSITDHLTGLFNRRYFQNIIDKKINLLSRHNYQFYFALIDIDFFKDYNDAYGHHKGDIALQEVSNVLKEILNRQTDYVFRVGGEEFAIIFEVDSKDNAISIMENLRKKVEDLKIIACNSTICNYLTISIGLGYIKKASPDANSDQIYDEVDKLLYESKDNGRNQITTRDIIV